MVSYGIFVLVAIFASSQAYDPKFFENAVDIGVYEPASMSRNLNCGNIKHPLGCTFSSDCSVKTCKVNFVGLTFEFKITINKCQDPVTVTIGFNVQPVNLKFDHTFPTDQTLPIPGLENGFGSLFRGGVFVKVKLRPYNGKLNVLVQLQCGIAIGNKPIFPVVLDLLKGPLPIDTSTCGGGGGGGGGLPPPPPPGGACSDTNPLCYLLGGQCSKPEVSGMCSKTCNLC